MKILDIFSGTKSVQNVCKERGWEYTSLDIEKKYYPDICVDFLLWDYTQYDKNRWDAIWFSPDCST